MSILLPVFNAAASLEACLQSLARQTLREFEIVVVDDGSSDASTEILKRWKARESRLRLIRQPHEGLIPALNHGLGLCRAPLVARMDADDIAHPKRLERQVTLLDDRPGVAVVSCLVKCFPRREVAQGFRLYEEWINGLTSHDDMARELFVESPVAHPSVVFRKEPVQRLGGYRDCAWPEDYDLWLRLFEDGAVFAKVGECLFFWRERGDRLSRTDERYSILSFLRCKAHFLCRGPVAAPARVVVWGAGITGRRLTRFLLAEGAQIEAIVDIDPSKIGRMLHGLPIISADSLADFLREQTIVIAAVASRGARKLIRERLQSLGLVEGKSFWCAA
ncbi:MAG: glycosyltransferase [Thermoanaerobaculales bacterium]|nr:glycosyltransferase [Thermoanaerobaculales bacterium]